MPTMLRVFIAMRRSAALDENAFFCYIDINKKFFGNFYKLPTKRAFRFVYIVDEMQDKLEKCVSKLKNGDRSAFDYVYERTNRTVYFTIFYIVRDKMHAEDVLQETYVRALSVLGQYRDGTDFIAWLRSIGRSLALNHLKKSAKEIPTDFDRDAYKYGTKETDLPVIFDIAARLLSEEEYEIIMLCHVAGYKRREVAEMLGMPISTVTWKNNEALGKLKKYLEKEGAK